MMIAICMCITQGSVDDDTGDWKWLFHYYTVALFQYCTITLLQASPEDSTCSASQTCVGCRCLEQVLFKDMKSVQMFFRREIFVEIIFDVTTVSKRISENISRDAIVTQLLRTQTGLELNKQIIDEYRGIEAA